MSNSVVVTVKNNATIDIFVAGDPNWDDQELMVDGEVIAEPYTLSKGKTVAVSVNWDSAPAEEMMGVIFARAKNYERGAFYQLAVGQDDTSNLAVTVEYTHGELDFKYTLNNQAPWSMTMSFTGQDV
jgi:hypothetical protein